MPVGIAWSQRRNIMDISSFRLNSSRFEGQLQNLVENGICRDSNYWQTVLDTIRLHSLAFFFYHRSNSGQQVGRYGNHAIKPSFICCFCNTNQKGSYSFCAYALLLEGNIIELGESTIDDTMELALSWKITWKGKRCCRNFNINLATFCTEWQNLNEILFFFYPSFYAGFYALWIIQLHVYLQFLNEILHIGLGFYKSILF